MAADAKRPFKVEPPQMTILADHPSRATDKLPDDLKLESRLAAVFDILRHKNTRCPITMAVYGDWGTGKTSAMRWLETKLREWNALSPEKREGHPRVYPVWFDPWRYHSREEVWRGIIAEVILSLFDVRELTRENAPKRLREAAQMFGGFLGKGFLHALANVELKLGKTDVAEVTVNGGMFRDIYEEFDKANHPEKGFLNQFEQTLRKWVTDFLRPEKEGQPGDRIALFIDDLDRCLPEVTLEVLEALKLYLNIEPLVFIVGLDRGVVEGVVCRHYQEHGLGVEKAKDYLNKIFQVDVQVSPSEEQMKAFLLQQIAGLNEASGGFWDEMLADTAHKKVLEESIRQEAHHNPREIKRLLNSALLRGHAATRIAPAASKLGFAQGVQVFLLQRVFLQRFTKAPQLLIEQASLQWLRDLSEFRKRYPDYNPFVRPAGTEPDAKSRMPPEAEAKPSDAEAAFKEIRQRSPIDEENKPLDFYVLANTPFWKLLSIPFSVEVAQQTPAPAENVPVSMGLVSLGRTPPAADPLAQMPTLIRDRVAAALGKPVKDLTTADLLTVTNLDLSLSKASDADLMHLAKLTALQSLSLWGTNVSDAGLEHVAKLTNLQSLDLLGTRVTDAGLKLLAELSTLQSLDLAATQVTDAGLEHVITLTNLRSLNLVGTHVSDRGLGFLATLTALQKLYLEDTKITDAGLAALAKLTVLQRLYLANTKITDAGLVSLAKLTNLQRLSLGDTNITNAGLAHLARLAALQTLGLMGTHVTDAGLAHLAKLTALRALDLENTKVSDAGLAHLDNLTALQSLDLINTQVTKRGVEKLRSLFGSKIEIKLGTDPKRR